jgi:hypothetical protein
VNAVAALTGTYRTFGDSRAELEMWRLEAEDEPSRKLLCAHRLAYVWAGLDPGRVGNMHHFSPSTAANPPRVTIVPTDRGRQVFLGGLLGFGNITIPGMTTTQTGKNLSSSGP